MTKLLKTLGAALLAAGILAAPASAAAPWKWCGRVDGNAVSAGRVTSCTLARKVARHDMDDFADGRRVRVKSPATGRTYRFFLWYSDAYRWVVHAHGTHGATLSVQVGIR